MAENGFQQIASGIVPDAVQPYDAQAVAQQKANPFKQIAAGIQPPPPTLYGEQSEQPKETSQSSQQPDTSGMLSFSEPETQEPKPETPWYQPAVDFGTAAKKEAYGLPYVGQPLQQVGQAVNNLNKMKHEAFGGEGQEAQPLHTAGAAGLSGIAGATSAPEAPTALATNAVSNLLIPEGMKTKRNFPPQEKGSKEAQAQEALQAKQAKEPERYTYNYGVEGKPAGRRLSELSEKTFPNQPAARATGELIGGMTPVIPGINAAEGVLGNLAKNPATAKILQGIAEIGQQHPVLANQLFKSMARGAAEGGAYNALFAAGGRAAEGQKPKVTGQDIASGAVFGGLLRPAAEGAGGVGRTIGKITKPRPVEESSMQEPQVQTEVRGQVLPPSKYTFKNKAEAFDTLTNSKSKPEKIDAAAQYLQQEGVNLITSEKLQAEQAQEAPQQTQSARPVAVLKNGQRIELNMLNYKPGPMTGDYLQANGNLLSSDAVSHVERAGELYDNTGKLVRQEVNEPAKPEITPEVQAIYDKIGKAPPKDIAPEKETASRSADALYQKLGLQRQEVAPSEEGEENIHVAKQRVPIDEVKEYNPETNNYTKEFDTSHNEPRAVKWRGKKYGAVLHPDEGYATLGGQIEQGGARKLSVFKHLDEGTSIPQQLLKEGKFNEIQQNAHERGLEEDREGNTPKAQAEAQQMVAKQQADAAKVQEAIENNDFDALEKLGQPKRVLSRFLEEEHGSAPPGYATAAVADTVGRLAKASGQTLKNTLALIDEDVPGAIVKFAKMQDTLDRIEEGGARFGSDIHDKLWHNIGKEAYHTQGLEMKGERGVEARRAIRSFSPDQIREGKEILKDAPQQVRDQIATKKIMRMENKQQIKEEINRLKPIVDKLKSSENPNDKGVLEGVNNYIQALKDYSAEQYGHYEKGNQFSSAMDGITGNLFNAFFRMNPAFHGLVATHPWQMGTAVAGVENVANAYKLMLSDPGIRELYRGLHTATEDIRMTAGQEAVERRISQGGLAGEVNKARIKGMDRDFITGRFNNEIIHLAGMLKAANKMFKGKGVEAIQKLVDRTLPEHQAIELMTEGMKAMRDATGSGTFAMNRSMLQDLPIARYFAQLSGYKHVVARYQSKLAQQSLQGMKMIGSGDAQTRADGIKLLKNSLGSTATLLGATILMGGHAVINKELEGPLTAIFGPDRMYALEQALDSANILAKFGVNITDHLQYSLLNYGENAALAGGGQFLRDAVHIIRAMRGDETDEERSPLEQWTSFIGHGLMATQLSAPLGIGMGTWLRAAQGLFNLAKGEKTLRIYQKDPLANIMSSSGIHPIGTGTENYSFPDFLHSLFVSGPESREYKFGRNVDWENKYHAFAPDEDVPYDKISKDYPFEKEGVDWE